jgi:hypothetical protein
LHHRWSPLLYRNSGAAIFAQEGFFWEFIPLREFIDGKQQYLRQNALT